MARRARHYLWFRTSQPKFHTNRSRNVGSASRQTWGRTQRGLCRVWREAWEKVSALQTLLLSVVVDLLRGSL